MKKKLIEAVIKNGFHKTNRFEYKAHGGFIMKRPLDCKESGWSIVRSIRTEDKTL